jgi:hypothetical protein
MFNKPKPRPRPPKGGGSPKIAAVINLCGNDCLRQAAEKPNLIDTALLCYTQAIVHDPEDPGLKVNLGIANLVKNDTSAAESQFVDAFELCNRSRDKLYALLGLKYGKDKFVPGTPVGNIEAILRAAIENSIPKNGTDTSSRRNQPFVSAPPTNSKAVQPEEAKEFLYIKTIDIEE